MKKSLYLANPYGFSAQQKAGPLLEIKAALEGVGAVVWEPFARNNSADLSAPGWAARESYPLNLMVFTGLPRQGWEEFWYASVEEIAAPAKALTRWLAGETIPGAG